ncbi:hypothetical protein [Streptomyces sp. SYSU K21746]
MRRPAVRLCWAQAWLHPMLDKARGDGYDPDAVVEAFTADRPDHELWDAFARTQLRGADSAVQRDTWGMKVNPDIVAPDVELVQFTPIPASGVIQPGERYEMVPLLMRYEEGPGWRILNFVSEAIPVPGWPPSMG